MPMTLCSPAYRASDLPSAPKSTDGELSYRACLRWGAVTPRLPSSFHPDQEYAHESSSLRQGAVRFARRRPS
jgi:hypothetical protein